MIPTRQTRPRMQRVRMAINSVVAVGLAMVAAAAVSAGASAADPLTIKVGAGEGQVSANAFFPGSVTIEQGSSITFLVDSEEPQSVSFGVGPTDVPPDAWPVAGWGAQAVPPGTPADLGEVTYDGNSFLNTGLVDRGSTATVTFLTPGTFTFSSPGHPGMSGEVQVVESGAGGLTTQAAADAAGDASRDALLSQVDAARAARLADVETVDAPDGTTTWNIFADASTVAQDLPGGGSGYLELFEMVPDQLAIGVGDTVHWSANGKHTVTFPAAGQDPSSIDPRSPAVGGDVYDGSSEYSSGLLNASPGAPTSYTLTFPTAGVFTYIDAQHQAAGQHGVISVGQPLSSGGPAGSGAPGASAGAAGPSPAPSGGSDY